MRARLLLAATIAALVPAVPSHATVAQFGAPTSWSATNDGRMCFTLRTGVTMAGTATAHGLVNTGEIPIPPLVTQVVDDVWNTAESLGLPPGTIGFSASSTVVADAKPLASDSGYPSVCVGGAGARIVYGSIVFTLDVHSTGGDWATVITCGYSWINGVDCS